MPDTIALWPRSDQPGDPLSVATLKPFLAANAAISEQAMVMVCPGGAYAGLAPHEADVIAHWLNDNGIHAAVLSYRLGPKHRHPDMINDAQRGMRLIRKNAEAWGVNPKRVAVLGFSAGGHLASTLATHADSFTSARDDLASSISARPDAAVLCYPVIDLGEHRHDYSRQMLLGEQPDQTMIEKLSNHKAVNSRTPPTFLWHTADDGPVPVENSLMFAAACKKHGVPFELHVYDSGPHGLGLALENPTVGGWPALCVAFLKKYLRA